VISVQLAQERKQEQTEQQNKNKGKTKGLQHQNSSRKQNQTANTQKPEKQQTTHLLKQSIGLHCHSYNKHGVCATLPTNHFQDWNFTCSINSSITTTLLLKMKSFLNFHIDQTYEFQINEKQTLPLLP
jgi:hypothetical protein